MMRSGADFPQDADLILTNPHVRLCLIQIAHIISLQKTSIKSKSGYHNQAQGLIRSGVLYKFDLIFKVSNLHLGLCLVLFENTYQSMNALLGTRMFMCYSKKMHG